MNRYQIRAICIEDYMQVTNIYNSNRSFLQNHLGIELIDKDFIHKEVLEMQSVGFNSDVIVDTNMQKLLGVLDYRNGEEVYLSLFMLTNDLQGKGFGREIYSFFEEQMKQCGSKTIRIDVVNDYTDNVIPFWRKMGFLECETVILEWGNKRSQAIVMRKTIV